MQPETGFQQTTKITVQWQVLSTKTIHFFWLLYVADPRQPLIIFSP
jgi:hypothetical protein